MGVSTRFPQRTKNTNRPSSISTNRNPKKRATIDGGKSLPMTMFVLVVIGVVLMYANSGAEYSSGSGGGGGRKNPKRSQRINLRTDIIRNDELSKVGGVIPEIDDNDDFSKENNDDYDPKENYKDDDYDSEDGGGGGVIPQFVTGFGGDDDDTAASSSSSSSEAQAESSGQNTRIQSSKFDPKTETNEESWKWFDGDVGKFYNILVESDSKNDVNNIGSYAVHRWMGKDRSTLIHYHLIYKAVEDHLPYFRQTEGRLMDDGDDGSLGLHVLDAGCGLGAGLMWFETGNPPSRSWDMVGHTISQAQIDFITEKLPKHHFRAELKSFDDLDDYIGTDPFDVIYSIEAFIHSLDGEKTLETWSRALTDDAIVILIDDFLSVGVNKNDDDIKLFQKSWMANTLYTSTELLNIIVRYGFEPVLDRDLGSEYDIIHNNYRNTYLTDLKPKGNKDHQGWLGSAIRQRLMVQGRLTYRMVVFRKKQSGDKGGKSKVQLAIEASPTPGHSDKTSSPPVRSETQCTAVQTATNSTDRLQIKPIPSQHMTGKGQNGGTTQKCISGWYCCGKGQDHWNKLQANRTDTTAYLTLPKSLFGNYMDITVHHLNAFYTTLSKHTTTGGGKFLDIGGTGSVASGMKQVTSKFAHFAGPFEYWVLDNDPKAASLSNAVFCDMSDCPAAKDCDYDVTFSHTVLEHTPRPWKAFDTIARVTKRGGLSIHVVPFSYQYHATPDDNFRFSHKALTSLMEDRGFTVLEVGYDICEKPEEVKRSRVDEHFDVIWLSYVIARKD